ncbi:hypothetical protein OEZ86_011003 [Tetradesmus obliquus]|nr:hypothetical protein OEZ86_011003 [Tetradesmus obliquus]
MVLGQGSLGNLYADSSRGSPSALPPARLGFRLFQLALAVALHQALLPGLASAPAAYDPDYDSFDRALLRELGFEVLADEPSYGVAGSGPALLYMPCCPRELYAAVLAANNGHLQQLAVFGTSMRSLADTQALVAALTAEPAASAAAPAGRSNVINRMLDVSSAEQSSSAVAQQGDVLQLAYKRGCVLEVPCPDCAAHGVGVAVHLFRTAQL